MITVPNRYGRTDGQTTYDSNTALCTKVHRAVKIIMLFENDSVAIGHMLETLNAVTDYRYVRTRTVKCEELLAKLN